MDSDGLPASPQSDAEAQAWGLVKVARVADGGVYYLEPTTAAELVRIGEYRNELWDEAA